jgi:hypothetical protein
MCGRELLVFTWTSEWGMAKWRTFANSATSLNNDSESDPIRHVKFMRTCTAPS